MPNTKISENTRDRIISIVNEGLNKRLRIARLDFPLTPMEVQQAIIPNTVRATINQLTKDGVETIMSTNEVFARIVDCAGFEVVCRMSMKSGRWIYAYNDQAERYGRNHKARKAPFDLDTLKPERREVFMAWMQEATEQHRAERLMKEITHEFFRNHSPTLYHFVARWPGLAKYILNKLGEPWTNKGRGVPGAYKLKRWGWPYYPEPEWRNKNADVMQLIENTILTVSNVNELNDASPVFCSTLAWCKLDGVSMWVDG